jgi:two-component system chemotaxis response regulator CheY
VTGRKLVALVVEDSPTMRQLIVFALRRIPKLSIVEAEDGLEALKKLAAQRFDIVLTDINMPVMDGLKLVHRITTEGGNEDRQRALALGANAYITKPIQGPHVLATVKDLLKLT